MDNGRLESPPLDDRLWQDIVDEAKALIPRYNPEWTDHNPTDLGITLIELFAWLVEGMIYRLNRVPDKNFIEFLNLIGITRDPATPATVLLSYRLANGANPVVLPKGSQAATQQTEKDAPFIFETDESIELVPVTTALYVHKVAPDYNNYQNVTANLLSAPFTGLSVDISHGDSIGIALGFDLATVLATVQAIQMRLQFKSFAQPHDLQVQWLYSQGGNNNNPGTMPPIPNVLDGTESFTKNGTVTLSVPVNWSRENPQNWTSFFPVTPGDAVQQPLFWIGILVSNLLSNSFRLQINSILCNTVPATNALTVTQPELLGTSTGQPFQFFDLKHVPLYRRPEAPDPYDHLKLEVRTPLVGGAFSAWTAWSRVEDFRQGAGSSYRLDPVTGRISFGNYDPTVSPKGHGSIPPSESEIQATTYRYVIGGAAGNVPSGTITVVRTPVTGVVGVTNLGAAKDGSDQESIEDTKRRGPEALRNRYRAVTVEDYEYLASEATTDVKKVRCLPPRHISDYDASINSSLTNLIGDPWTYGGLNRDTGNVNVIVIPGVDLSNPTPVPSAELLQEVADYLEERRVVTTALTVTGPRYLPIKVTADINIWQKAVHDGLVDPTAFPNQLIAKINQFLHPVLGADGTGWQVGDDQTIAPLFDFIKPDSEVGFISKLMIEALPPLYSPSDRPYVGPLVGGGPGVWVKFADYEMVCSATGPVGSATGHVITLTVT